MLYVVPFIIPINESKPHCAEETGDMKSVQLLGACQEKLLTAMGI